MLQKASKEANMCIKYLNTRTQIKAHACTWRNIQIINRTFSSLFTWWRTELVEYNLWCDWFKRCLMLEPTWLSYTHPPLPPTLSCAHTHTSTRKLLSLLTCSSPTLRLWNVHHTSDLRESQPKSFLWIIEEDQASLTLIILRSICLASPPITSNASDDRSDQSEESLQLEMQSVLFCIVYTDTAWRV